MAFCNLRYDTCAYKNYLAQEVGEFAYQIDPVRYQHPHPRRMEFGIVGGNDVSILRDYKSMVDLESDLKGQTRLASRCPTLDYQSPCPTTDMNVCNPKQVIVRGNPSNMGRVIDTTPMHLRPAQMFKYTPIQTDPYMLNPPRC